MLTARRPIGLRIALRTAAAGVLDVTVAERYSLIGIAGNVTGKARNVNGGLEFE
jgi:hypothetical protein